MKRLLLIAALLWAASAAQGHDVAAHWKLLDDKSAVEWTASYGGKPVSGSFPAFTADVAFDAEHVEQSRATVKIDLAKIRSEDRDAQQNLPGPEWFFASQWPLATFEATHFRHIAEDRYEAEGTLAMHGKTVALVLPFTAKFYDDNDASPPAHYARIQGELTLNRTDWGVGQGDWAMTDTVADAVKIVVRLEARQVP